MTVRIYANIGDVHRQCERYTEAAAMYHKILEIVPNFARAHYELGNMYLKQRQYDEALWRFNKTLELDALFHKAILGRALTHYQMERYREAWADIVELEKRNLEVNPDFRESVVRKIRKQRAETIFRPGI